MPFNQPGKGQLRHGDPNRGGFARLWCIGLALLLAAVIWSPWTAAAQPSAGWSQFQADAAHTGFAQGPAPPYAAAWTHAVPPVGQAGLSAPAVASEAGRAVTVGARSVLAVDLQSGDQAWTKTRVLGPVAPPAVGTAAGVEIAIFTQGGLEDTKASVRAVALEDGSDVWKKAVALKAVSRTGVTLEGKTALVGDDRGNVYAVDVGDGSLTWTRQLGTPLVSPLAAAGGLVVAMVSPTDARTSPSVVALDAGSGDAAWTAQPSLPPGQTSAPVIDAGNVYVGLTDGAVHAFDMSDGHEVWTGRSFYAGFFPTAAGAAAGGDVVFADTQGDVRRLDGSTGEQIWNFSLNATTLRSSPVVSGSTVVIGLREGTIAAIRLDDGLLRFRGGPGSGQIGPITVTSDLLLAPRGGEQGGLTAFRTDPQGALLAGRSPSSLDPAGLIGRFALAALALLGVLYLPARAIAARVGPLELEDVDAGELDEDEDGSRPDDPGEDLRG